ncbi:hypothetical protein L7F22_022539 [Adiantum nelumboides]|nr:hypothetical protein [Adiantum nelumboides]
MKITLKSSTIVKPATETPKCIVWNSNIDLVIPRIHIPTVYFYKTEGAVNNTFDCVHLKESLGRALVPFYPMAGRLKDKGRGRIDINCNGDGVLFVEAVSDGCLSEYGEYFAPCMKMRQLIPQVDYSKGHSSFPLLVLQVTFFNCGGVALGVGVHHHVADGLAALWFLNYWADVARGVEKVVKPFFDRTLLKARDPPKPKFQHAEYQLPPPLLKAKDADCKKEFAISIVNNNCYSKVNGDYIKVNDANSKTDGDLVRVNGEHSKVDAAVIKMNGDPTKVNGDYIKENGDFVKVNGHQFKGNGDHIKVNGDGLKEHDVFTKGNSTYSLANGDHGKVNDSLNLANGDCTAINGNYHSSLTHVITENGGYVKKHEPVSGMVFKEHELKHPLSVEELGKMTEDKPNTEYYGPISAELFIFSQDQVSSLKKKAEEHAVPGNRPFTSYEVLSAHIWRCACLARDLQDAQFSKLFIATDGRSRLQPALPPDYFGNVIFTASPVAQVGQLVGAPLADAARHIRRTVQVMDDEYLRSAVDYLELQPNLAEFSRGAHTFQTPNLGITSWMRLPIYGADFGWGPPLSMAPAGVPFEGLAYLLPGPPGDKRFRLSITLSPDHMLRFQELIYQV